jgi:hypothetical protein
MKNLIVFILIFFAGSSFAAFKQQSRRYLAPRDFSQILTQKFPVMNGLIDTIPLGECQMISMKNRGLLGTVSPALGTPNTENPTPNFVRWLGSCVTKIAQAQFVFLQAHPKNLSDWRRYWPPSVLNHFKDAGDSNQPFHRLNETDWSTLSLIQKAEIVSFNIESMIGPESVLKDLGQVKSMSELVDRIRSIVDQTPGKTVFQATEQIVVAVALREEFISF